MSGLDARARADDDTFGHAATAMVLMFTGIVSRRRCLTLSIITLRDEVERLSRYRLVGANLDHTHELLIQVVMAATVYIDTACGGRWLWLETSSCRRPCT